MIPPIDVPPELSDRVRGRAHRVLAAGPRTAMDRWERAFIARIEPTLAAVCAVALVVWAVHYVLTV